MDSAMSSQQAIHLAAAGTHAGSQRWHLGSVHTTESTSSLRIKNQDGANDKDGQCFPAWHLLASPTSSTAAPLLRLLQPTGLPPRCSLNNKTVLPLRLGSLLPPTWDTVLLPPPLTVSHSIQAPAFPGSLISDSSLHCPPPITPTVNTPY